MNALPSWRLQPWISTQGIQRDLSTLLGYLLDGRRVARLPQRVSSPPVVLSIETEVPPCHSAMHHHLD